ncbi:MAG: manganese efflux pump [Spirochaetales bacterium]|nr:manganese efflux pump [Spirochaetales bacterium]
MSWSVSFFVNSALLGVGLAMDAFSVSIVNGIREPDMPRLRMCGIAGVYAFFQFLMPVIGWVCVHTLVSYFEVLTKYVPWIALALLMVIGINMLVEGLKGGDQANDDAAAKTLTIWMLLMQGIATSIDALSVGFTIAEYDIRHALTAALIIAGETFVICIVGLLFGRRIGVRLADKSEIVGGVILIGIGVEIFIKGVFFG